MHTTLITNPPVLLLYLSFAIYKILKILFFKLVEVTQREQICSHLLPPPRDLAISQRCFGIVTVFRRRFAVSPSACKLP